VRLREPCQEEASLAARRCEEVKGGPDPPAPALDSIVAAVAGENAERFLVCTQDQSLRIRLMKDSPMVPVVFCHTSGLQMEPPVDATASGTASQEWPGVFLIVRSWCADTRSPPPPLPLSPVSSL
jgi:U3 small nucleolar RNA-associated protein 23